MEVGGNYDKVERSVWCLPSARELLILWHIRHGGIAAITCPLLVTYLWCSWGLHRCRSGKAYIYSTTRIRARRRNQRRFPLCMVIGNLFLIMINVYSNCILFNISYVSSLQKTDHTKNVEGKKMREPYEVHLSL